MRTTSLRGLVAAVLVAVVLGAVPGAAVAHHKEGHERGRGEATGTAAKPRDDDRSRHPSGKSREQNAGAPDDEQGKSPSDPDGMENGGADKPGGSGGVYDWDQDGNNGCGNDTDFEDDNRGNCGPREKPRAAGGCPKARPETASRGRGEKLGHGKVPGACRKEEEASSPAVTTDVGAQTSPLPPLAGATTAGPEARGATAARAGGARVRSLEVSRTGATDAHRPAPAAPGRAPAEFASPLPLTGAFAVFLLVGIAAALLAAGAVLLRLRRGHLGGRR